MKNNRENFGGTWEIFHHWGGAKILGGPRKLDETMSTFRKLLDGQSFYSATSLGYYLNNKLVCVYSIEYLKIVSDKPLIMMIYHLLMTRTLNKPLIFLFHFHSPT